MKQLTKTPVGTTEQEKKRGKIIMYVLVRCTLLIFLMDRIAGVM